MKDKRVSLPSWFVLRAEMIFACLWAPTYARITEKYGTAAQGQGRDRNARICSAPTEKISELRSEVHLGRFIEAIGPLGQSPLSEPLLDCRDNPHVKRGYGCPAPSQVTCAGPDCTRGKVGLYSQEAHVNGLLTSAICRELYNPDSELAHSLPSMKKSGKQNSYGIAR